MISYYHKTSKPALKSKKKHQPFFPHDTSKIIIVMLASFGVLLSVLLFSWLTLNPGIFRNKYTHFKPLHAINTARLTGKIIIAELENPLKGGIVTVSYRHAIIGKDGMYDLPMIKPGTYTMTVMRNNRILYEQPVTLEKGENTVNLAFKTIVPGCMARHITEDMTDEELFKPVTPAVYTRGNPRLKRVAITIDDGWFEHHTLLDLFKSYGIRCTVFIIGGKGIGNARPEWIKKMDTMGFEVCMHTLDHSIITTLTNEKLMENLRKAQMNITKVTHKIYPYFRPPFGTYDKRTLEVVAAQGFKIIQWTVSIKDTNSGVIPEKQVAHVMDRLQNGAIILAHFGAHNTLAVIKELIPRILEKGYEIVTVSEVLEGLE
ncbi:MAG: polysaccharide deacetylase family protein [Spirochaetales bacterium]|nr:polysaccharide deacetylase family protein [Spirochaetales bacterium]